MRALMAVLRIVAVAIIFLSFPISAADGKTIYTNRCRSCHGTDGKGVANVAKMRAEAMTKETNKVVTQDEMLARMNLIADRNKKRCDADLMKIVRGGQGAMKGIASISDDDLKSVIAHVRTLQNSPPPK